MNTRVEEALNCWEEDAYEAEMTEALAACVRRLSASLPPSLSGRADRASPLSLRLRA